MNLTQTKTLPEIGTSHNKNIKKKIIIEKGKIPNLTTFATATFKSGQSVETHTHETMYEVFYIESGKAEFVVDDKRFEVTAGDCITIEPGEKHSQSNPYDEDVVWIYFGVAVE
ncbi:MAG: cupin domain-containing protein [Candidatus Magasanikbacteria bacterium]|jgi:mannose-6-phosphate isomerase-like protein (cupin superfamily)|nr:cupin domain-containing protein [Candidatus Magasanikbacteria bacterium]MBT4071354.1 cupin domain-containing protein [Candidatus Magasanikbacteria bacterium]